MTVFRKSLEDLELDVRAASRPACSTHPEPTLAIAERLEALHYNAGAAVIELKRIACALERLAEQGMRPEDRDRQAAQAAIRPSTTTPAGPDFIGGTTAGV